jgi:hypothetical protein
MAEVREYFALFDRTEWLDELLAQIADEAFRPGGRAAGRGLCRVGSAVGEGGPFRLGGVDGGGGGVVSGVAGKGYGSEYVEISTLTLVLHPGLVYGHNAQILQEDFEHLDIGATTDKEMLETAYTRKRCHEKGVRDNF